MPNTLEAPDQVTVAVAQYAPTDDSSENRELIATAVQRAAALGARVVLAPEYANAFINPFDETLASRAENLDGPFIAHLTRLAREHGLVVAAGILESLADGERPSNTAVAVNANGLVATYRKVHLYDAFGQRESDWITPGAPTAPETFDVDGLRFGLITCYDLRFPESTRQLADAGVDVALVPAEWVRGPLKEHHWRTLATARAIENTAYVVAADHTPPVGVGNSMVIDPEGTQLAALGSAPGVVAAQLSRAEIDRVRRVNPALDLRRYRVSAMD